MPTEIIPRRGQIWECADGRTLLVIQHDGLNAELQTVVGLLATDVAQRAPEPVRVVLGTEATGLDHRLWVKVPLFVTVSRSLLARLVATVDPAHLARVEAAVIRAIDLRIDLRHP